MKTLEDFVRSRPVVGDGAMGTMIQAGGLAYGTCPDLMNIEEPDRVLRIHLEYKEAGADYLETNTFGSTRLKLAPHKLDSRIEEIILRGVELARKAAGEECLVAGSMGPTGKILEPYGDTAREAVVANFREQAELMDRAAVDFFLVETMTDIAEARAALEAIKSVSERPIVATAVFAAGARGYRTLMGTAAGDAARDLAASGAVFVGTNCCNGMADALGIMRAMREGTAAAIVAQPNAGLPRLEAGRLVYPETPEAMAAGVPALLGAGVRVIGGCCGTTPAHIRAIAAAVHNR